MAVDQPLYALVLTVMVKEHLSSSLGVCISRWLFSKYLVIG
jgi:hypothetical protein